MSACTNALSLADRAGWAVHPHGGFLSLATGESIVEILVAEPETLLIAQASPEMTVLRSWTDLGAEEIAARRPNVAIAGVDACIVKGHGGVFVFTQAAAREAETNFMQMVRKDDGACAVRDDIRANWGRAALIGTDPGISVWRIEIAPGAARPAECHFRRVESWSVASGNGHVVLDGETRQLNPGDVIKIDRGVTHSISNRRTEPLILYETRVGASLGDDDTLMLARPELGARETA